MELLSNMTANSPAAKRFIHSFNAFLLSKTEIKKALEFSRTLKYFNAWLESTQVGIRAVPNADRGASHI